MCSHKLDSSAPAPPSDNDYPNGWVGYNGIGMVSLTGKIYEIIVRKYIIKNCFISGHIFACETF